jgi:hypothetical protein
MVTSNKRELPPTPPTGDSGPEPKLGGHGQPGDPAREDAPVGVRIDRNPGNLGDEVADEGDLTFPNVVPAPAEM